MGFIKIFSDGDVALKSEGYGRRWLPEGAVLPEKFVDITNTMAMFDSGTEETFGQYYATVEDFAEDGKAVTISGLSEGEVGDLQSLFTERGYLHL